MYTYDDYLKDNLPSDRYIEYTEYCTENIRSNIQYNEYMEPDIIYTEYVSENIYKKSKQQIQKEERVEKLKKIKNINDGIG